jgi:hypothetical protein
VTSPARRSRRVWFAALAIAAGGVVLLIGAVFVPPGWWAPPTAVDGSRFEHDVAAEVSRVRPASEATWSMGIAEDALNAWLAHRLRRWVDHDEALAWPEGLANVQVHLGNDHAIELAARQSGIVWRVRFRATVEEETIAFTPEVAHAGLLRVPEVGLEWLLSLLPEGTITQEGVIRMPTVGSLGDGRRVALRGVESMAGVWVLRLETISSGEDGQKNQGDVFIEDD